VPPKFRAFFGNAPVKLIAVILFAILVPSVLVTALGLVAVFQADAFVQDRFSRPQRAKVDKLRARLEVEWSRRLSLYTDSFRDARRRGPYLGELRRKDPWIRDVLVSGPRGLELVPELPPRELWSPTAEADLKELGRLELQEKNPAQALAECRRILAASDDEAVLVEATLIAARLSWKAGSREESEQFLRVALDRYGGTVDVAGVVRAVPILWRLIEIQRDTNQGARVKETARDLASALERYGPYLDPDVAAFFRDKLSSLVETPTAAAAQPPSARLFTAAQIPKLAEHLSLPPIPPPGPQAAWIETHFSVGELGELDFVSFTSDDGATAVHVALDRARHREEVEQACAEEGLPPGGLRLISNDARPVADAESPTGELAAVPLPPPFRNLELKYFPAEGLLPAGFHAFDVISLAAFTWSVIVLVLAIVVGVWFTLRSVLREMRTARLKTDFVSFITHELKTPLTAINTLTETMLAGRIETAEENRLCIQMISAETERLAKLVDQVLEYSRIERREKQFRFTSCDMEDVVREAVRLFKDHNPLNNREIEINSAQHISKIKMDRAAMVELLLNLLSNASKYSPPEKTIVVNLHESIDEICVEVVDRGVGIRKRDQKKIFEKFFRADDYLTRDVEGTGLGLTFARYIAKVHNGEIRVSSQLSSGSTFTLQLRKTDILGVSPMQKKSEKPGGKAKILIVEDDAAIIFGLQKNLQFEGYEVLAASDGETGLRRALDDRPDLIILDIMLPRINGFEICEILRKKKIATPVIFLSAKAQETDKILGLDLGGDDYITKPFSVRELLARVKTVLRRVQEDEPEEVSFGDVAVNFTSQTVKLRGADVSLTSKEFELLRLLVRSEGKVLPRDSILNKVWGYDYYGTSRTIDNFINRLRQKIEDDIDDPRHILTVRGVGYKFQS
jgi:two-component system alkaline phosphatase synthesis response regulator PhoP